MLCFGTGVTAVFKYSMSALPCLTLFNTNTIQNEKIKQAIGNHRVKNLPIPIMHAGMSVTLPHLNPIQAAVKA